MSIKNKMADNVVSRDKNGRFLQVFNNQGKGFLSSTEHFENENN